MKNLFVCLVCALAALVSVAAPAGKGGKAAKAGSYENVAEGYPAWAGLDKDENLILGRRLCPSDLRQKVTLVFWVDAKSYETQFTTIAKTVAGWNPQMYVLGSATETFVPPRDTICLVIFVGKEIPAKRDISKFLSKNSEEFGSAVWYIYTNVTCSKAPDHGDKLPYFCVFGPEPGDPLASGEYNDETTKKVNAIRREKKKLLENWKPYYGTIEEPTAVKNFTKTLTTGKPLEALTQACYKGVTNKDPDKAKECQILYDALEQVRSDYLFSIVSLAPSCPTRAFYEAQIVTKQFPKTKKTLKAAMDRINNIPDAPQLCKMFIRLKQLGDENFKCKSAGEAKKYEQELLRMKTVCDGLIKKSNVNAIQSAAAWIGNEAEMLAPQMASKAPAK